MEKRSDNLNFKYRTDNNGVHCIVRITLCRNTFISYFPVKRRPFRSGSGSVCLYVFFSKFTYTGNRCDRNNRCAKMFHNLTPVWVSLQNDLWILICLLWSDPLLLFGVIFHVKLKWKKWKTSERPKWNQYSKSWSASRNLICLYFIASYFRL